MEDIQNCSFQPRQLANERPTLGKGMVAKKAIQISTRIEYRGLSRRARQQVVPYEGRKVVRAHDSERCWELLIEAVEQSVEIGVGVNVNRSIALKRWSPRTNVSIRPGAGRRSLPIRFAPSGVVIS